MEHTTNRRDLTFNPKIKAYTFRYDSAWKIKNRNKFSTNFGAKYHKNGDIAIIIDTSTNGLDLQKYKAIPICLPTPKTFEVDNVNKGLPVIAAGRGARYAETTDGVTGQQITSCFVNQGLVRNRGYGYEGAENKVLSCKGYNRRYANIPTQDICISLSNTRIYKQGQREFSAENAKSISTDSTINFSQHTDYIYIKPPQNDMCEDYWQIAEQALKEMKERHGIEVVKPNDFTTKPDRILVINSLIPEVSNFGTPSQYLIRYLMSLSKKNNPGNKKNTPGPIGVRCYNLQKLAQHGVCETGDAKYPWGFCSPSCSKSRSIQNTDNTKFEKMDAKYHEKTPKSSFFWAQSLRKNYFEV